MKHLVAFFLAMLLGSSAFAQLQPQPVYQSRLVRTVANGVVGTGSYVYSSAWDTTPYASVSLNGYYTGACDAGVLVVMIGSATASGPFVNVITSNSTHALTSTPTQWQVQGLTPYVKIGYNGASNCTVYLWATFNAVSGANVCEGPAANGSAATYAYPVLMGGWQTGTSNAKTMRLTSDGDPICTGPAGTSANQVQGAAANGAAGTGINPVLISGLNSVGNQQRFAIDYADYDSGAGTENITMLGVALPASGGAVAGGTVTAPFAVQGPAAAGAAASGNPIRIGAKDGSNNTQDIQADLQGRLIQAPLTDCTCGEILVLNSASTVLTAFGAAQREITWQNLGPNPIFCSWDGSDAVVNKGMRLGTNDPWSVGRDNAENVECIAATADQVTTAATWVCACK